MKAKHHSLSRVVYRTKTDQLIRARPLYSVWKDMAGEQMLNRPKFWGTAWPLIQYFQIKISVLKIFVATKIKAFSFQSRFKLSSQLSPFLLIKTSISTANSICLLNFIILASVFAPPPSLPPLLPWTFLNCLPVSVSVILFCSCWQYCLLEKNSY